MASHSPAFLLIPAQQQDTPVMHSRHRPSFPIASAASLPKPDPPKFKPPAHKHAHHLHSIPPREKSTRTLILDHMLCLHARARFEQVRAELGMSQDDAEDIAETLRYGTDRNRPADVQMRERPAESKAKAAKARADGLEKVLAAMLDQPPEQLPWDDDEHSSPKSAISAPLHTLPNGVRLRLALSELINDLFARVDTPSEALPALASISAQSATTLPSFQSFARSTTTDPPPLSLPPLFSQPTLPPLEKTWQPLRSPHSIRRSAPATWTRDLYAAGVPPSTTAKCSRHLTTDCRTCSPSSTSSAIGAGLSFRRPGRSFLDPGSNSALLPLFLRLSALVALELALEASPTNSASLSPPLRFVPANPPPSSSSTFVDLHVAGTGSGHGPYGPYPSDELHYPSASASYPPSSHGTTGTNTTASTSTRASSESSDTDLSDAESSRGVRRKSGRGFPMPLSASSRGLPTFPPSSTSAPPPPPASTSTMSPGNKKHAARPTREWYALLTGLLTRAVLEGYLHRGWRGIEPVEILLSIGFGTPQNEEKERESQFEPDEMPTVGESARVLFVGAKKGRVGGLSIEAEFESEMESRLNEFLTIPPSTPDLNTHLQNLSSQYPAEPVERAALRFCEAVAEWRGKPELETYKPASKSSPQSTPTPSVSIPSLIHPTSSPPPAAPPASPPAPSRFRIERYFSLSSPRPTNIPMSPTRSKRPRDSSGDDPRGGGKKVALPGKGYADDWVGPYGM